MANVLEHSFRPRLSDLALALVFLTRLPWPGALDATRPVGRVAWAFPLIGAALGGLAGLVWLVAASLALPTALAAGVVVAALALVTGGLHEDGLADSADGLASGRLGAAALAIMRDSRVGAHGVLAMLLAVGLKWGAVAAWPPATVFAALIALHAWARALMLLPVWIAGPATSDGLGAAGAFAAASAAALALALAAAVGLLALPAPVFLAMAVVSGLVVGGFGWLAKRRIGGYTGDVLGASEQLAETAGAVTLVAALAAF
ncbi:MAG: adenosylcobinamide-GDP ribazoletransferase [Alphaproteobacteria bacterium]|nr:adenosylcobinamide-GDP ribazoletransferase [Alphaproteobacteria bacterium]